MNINKVLSARAAADGDGVRIQRVVNGRNMQQLDPFLLLDEFNSAQADDYIGGFPAHPHRGFVTITYMLTGCMQHKDSLGNQGLIKDGGVQWMKAASGVIHSEMPQQANGLMRGFQLWLNLPAEHKMDPPDYRDIDASELPIVTHNGLQAKLIAGHWLQDTKQPVGPLTQQHPDILYWDLQFNPDSSLILPREAHKHYYLYVYEGAITVQHAHGTSVIDAQQLWLAQDSDQTLEFSTERQSRALLLAGMPLNEPIAHYGPFVMNTQDEIQQALVDYRDGALVKTHSA